MSRAPHRILLTAATLAAVATPLAASAASAAYLGTIGRPGTGAGSLGGPWGVATAPDGRVLVTDAARGTVAAFDSVGHPAGTFGALSSPAGITVGPAGIYVAERGADRVARFGLTGTALGTLGSRGVANGQFITPEDVAMQGSRLLVTSQYRFQRFNPATGAYIDGHGGAGTGLGNFEGLRAIGTTDDGGIFTSEVTNDRVQRFANDFFPLSTFGATGTLDGQFTAPSGLAVDSPSSSVWVSDQITGKIQRFGFGGQLRDIVGPGPADDPGHLSSPTDVAVDCRGTLYVVDAVADHVVRFGAPEAATPGNLLVNGGAEDSGASCGVARAAGGAGPGWSGGGVTAVHYGAEGGFPARADGDAADGGQSFLAGGPAAAQAVTEQTVDVSAQALDIDDGRRLATLSGLLGGFGTQDDAARVEAVYRSATGATLGTTAIGPVTAADRAGQTKLLARRASATVPSGTRAIRVRVTMVRAAGGGSYLDAYADRLALTLTPQRPAPARAPGSTGTGPGSSPAGGLRLSVRTASSLASRGRLVVTVGCDVRCGTRLGLTRGGVSVAAAGRTGITRPRSITLQLSRSARKGLRRAVRRTGSARLVLTVRAKDARGRTAVVTRTLTVRG